MNTFERLLEEDPWVRKQIARGEEKGKVLDRQQALVDVVGWRYPSLLSLAQQRAAQLTHIDALNEVIRLLVIAPDEATARFILSTPPGTQTNAS